LEAVDVVARLAAEGDEATLRAIKETGKWLGLGISNLVNLFNPDVIVLGGLYHRLFDYLEASVLEGASRALQASQEMAEIRRSNIGANAPLIGAAELALAQVIDDPAHVADL
jgi:predicted NBD/HSP70 family sugar kinase